MRHQWSKQTNKQKRQKISHRRVLVMPTRASQGKFNFSCHSSGVIIHDFSMRFWFFADSISASFSNSIRQIFLCIPVLS